MPGMAALSANYLFCSSLSPFDIHPNHTKTIQFHVLLHSQPALILDLPCLRKHNPICSLSVVHGGVKGDGGLRGRGSQAEVH